MLPVFIDGMHGMGDNIYQRGFVKKFPGAYIKTPWPEIYEGLDVKFVRSNTTLRTQQKNESVSGIQWHDVPANARRIKVGYGVAHMRAGSVLDAMANQFGVSSDPLDLPEFKINSLFPPKLAIVRPVTERSEWLNQSRNPDPQYIYQAAAELKRRGYYVVSIADLDDGKEWLCGDAPPADIQLHKGELKIKELLSLVQHAKVIVGGVGWILPAAVAYNVPLALVLGGNGGCNHPTKVTSSIIMNLGKLGCIYPDDYCMCEEMKHSCNKKISNFDSQFKAFLDERIL